MARRIVDIDGSELIRRMGEGRVAISGFQGIGPVQSHRHARSRVRYQRGGHSGRGQGRSLMSIQMSIASHHGRKSCRLRVAWRISFEEMLEMASLGAKVLQVRSVELAMVRGLHSCARQQDPDAPGMADKIPREPLFATRMKSWNSRLSPELLFQGRGADLVAPRCRPSGRLGRHIRRWRKRTSMWT